MIDLDELIDIAPRGVASQSTLSQFSLPNGAQALVESDDRDFSIHTEHEYGPWWLIDLGQAYPLHRIVIGNRVNPYLQYRANNLRVEISTDGQFWTLLHAGFTHFGDGLRTPGMVLELNSQVFARHIRLSLPETEALHLRSLQIFAQKRALILADLWDRHQLPQPDNTYSRGPDKAVTLVAIGKITDPQIVGLKVRTYQRLGNNFIQLMNALHVARYLGLKTVWAPKIAFGDRNQDVHADGISLIASDSIPPDGLYLENTFFFLHLPMVYQTLSAQIRRQIAERLIMPLLGVKPVAPAISALRERELVIHMRSGDIFSQDPHAEYVQPPLGYYTQIIRQLATAGKIDSVCIVAEDRGNPCVDGLEAWLNAKYIPVRFQNGTLAEDIDCLRHAKHVIYGYGTFGFAVSLIAGEIDTLHIFDMQELVNEIPNAKGVYIYTDKAGAYIKRGEWRNTPEQRDMMLDYPAENIQRIL